MGLRVNVEGRKRYRPNRRPLNVTYYRLPNISKKVKKKKEI